MTFRSCGALTGICLLAAALPALAHHSFQAEFDEKKLFQLTGVLAKVEWSNPDFRYMHAKTFLRSSRPAFPECTRCAMSIHSHI